jgi:phosphomannomutase
MDSLMIGVSGIRGIVGRSLTPELLTRFALAFGTYLDGGRVLVARDTRTSGDMIKHSMLAGLVSAGCSVIDIGICPTPTASVMIAELGADGGVVITGSHNPIEWNALKFMGADGICLSEDDGKRLLDIYYKGDFTAVDWSGLKEVTENHSALDVHIGKVLTKVNVEAIKARKFKVALDSCNGAGSVITPRLLEELGCEVTKVHCTPNGLFPHNPEPTFEHLEDLCQVVSDGNVDVGFAQDADADRLAIIDEAGRYLGEEYSLALAAMHILATRPGTVAANLSTSRMIDDVAAARGCRVVRTKVGEANVAAAMKANNCVVGGEGNGGVIDPRTCYTRDSLSGMALVLELLAGKRKPLSAVAGEIPRYAISKKKFAFQRGKVTKMLGAVKDAAEGARVNELDGVRLDWPDRWVHVRPSNTEPAVRVISEAPTAAEADTLCDKFMKLAEGAAT